MVSGRKDVQIALVELFIRKCYQAVMPRTIMPPEDAARARTGCWRRPGCSHPPLRLFSSAHLPPFRRLMRHAGRMSWEATSPPCPTISLWCVPSSEVIRRLVGGASLGPGNVPRAFGHTTLQRALGPSIVAVRKRPPNSFPFDRSRMHDAKFSLQLPEVGQFPFQLFQLAVGGLSCADRLRAKNVGVERKHVAVVLEEQIVYSCKNKNEGNIAHKDWAIHRFRSEAIRWSPEFIKRSVAHG